MKIIFHAEDCSMGDTSPEDCNKFRQWALRVIRDRFPEYEVEVSAEPSLSPVHTDDDLNAEEIVRFCGRLWDRCPWNFE